MGDPAGIGPEVTCRAIPEILPLLKKRALCVIGSRGVIEKRCPGFSQKLRTLRSPAELDSAAEGEVLLLDPEPDLPEPEAGKGTPETGAASLVYIDTALSLYRAGKAGGMVTGPVSKELICASGTPFTGHTEYIAGQTGGEPLMMMFSPAYRVVLMTTHIPLERVPASLTSEKLEYCVREGLGAQARMDGERRPLAVAGLDPHAGDGGVIGTWDRDVARPVIERLRKEGLPVEGPLPADTLFMPGVWKRYGMVVAQYHDQGLVPFKALAFDLGVNVTLGLPLVRTSVDHGTAFDIAGKGTADHRSMVEAVLLALRLTDQG
jgi:4-hydroxythreonine-4-phosphate dehydrogenase